MDGLVGQAKYLVALLAVDKEHTDSHLHIILLLWRTVYKRNDWAEVLSILENGCCTQI